MKKNEKRFYSELDTSLFCRITESNKKWLDSYVYDTFGTNYALSKVINDLITDFRDTSPHIAHTHLKKEAFRSLDKIRQFFLSYPDWENGVKKELDYKIKQRIGEFFGFDSRTRKKYFDAMLELGVLFNPSQVPGKKWIIFEVDLGPLGLAEPVPISIEEQKRNLEGKYQ